MNTEEKIAEIDNDEHTLTATLYKTGELIIKCNHHLMRYVRYIIANGAVWIKKQCFNCGEVSDKTYKKKLHPNFESYPKIDIKLRDKAYKFRTSVWAEIYSEYLKSEDWQVKRKFILKRDNYLCQKCYKNRATQVHHLTYDHVFNEKQEDLISICDFCHKLQHDQ